MYARRHRASSPPLQRAIVELDDWMRNLRSVDQHPYKMVEIQSLKLGPVAGFAIPKRESDNEFLSNQNSLSEENNREYE